MEIDIYGDLDNLDNEYEKVQKENTHLKETVTRLEEISAKFSKEIAELKRINCKLEFNISSLYKTAKAEIDRKTRQISELTKEKDNMIFKRGGNKNIFNTAENKSQQNEFLTKQYEQTKHALEQKNRIIHSLNTELDIIRKELGEKNNPLKRNSSQVEESTDRYTVPKKPKLDKQTYVDNEEEYRRYIERERRDTESPEYRRYNSGKSNELRSRIDLKSIRYQGNRFRSNVGFRYNKRFGRGDFKQFHYKRKYGGSKNLMEYNGNYSYKEETDRLEEHNNFESQNDYREQTDYEPGAYNENVRNNEYPLFFDSPTFKPKFKNQLEEGELDYSNVNFDSDFKSRTLLKDSKKDHVNKEKYNIKRLDYNQSKEFKDNTELNFNKFLQKIDNENIGQLDQVKQEQIGIQNSKDYVNIGKSELFKIKSDILEALQNPDIDCNYIEDKPAEIKQKKLDNQNSEINKNFEPTKIISLENSKPDENLERRKQKISYKLNCESDKNIDNSELPKIKLVENPKLDEKLTQTKQKKFDKLNHESNKSIENFELSKIESHKLNYESDQIIDNSELRKIKLLENPKPDEKLTETKNKKFDKSCESNKSTESSKLAKLKSKSSDATSSSGIEIKSKISYSSKSSKTSTDSSEKKSSKTPQNTKHVKFKIDTSLSDSKSKNKKSNSKTDEIINKVVNNTKQKKPEEIESEKTVRELKNILFASEAKSVQNKEERQCSNLGIANISIVSEPKYTKSKKEKKISESNESNISLVAASCSLKTKTEIPESDETNVVIVSEMNHTKTKNFDHKDDDIDKNISALLKSDSDEFSISLIQETYPTITSNSETKPKDISRISESNTVPILRDCVTSKQNDSISSSAESVLNSSVSSSTIEEKSSTSNESQNNFATQNQKPPIKGRRRRCVISIT